MRIQLLHFQGKKGTRQISNLGTNIDELFDILVCICAIIECDIEMTYCSEYCAKELHCNCKCPIDFKS